MHLLLVEDDTTIAMGLTYSFQQEGYVVHHTKTVGETRQLLQREDTIPFSIAILDLNLPDGSGYDICRQLKQTTNLPVIFLSAIDDEVNVVMGLDLGADDYITKPFRIAELLSRIKAVLRRSNAKEPQEVLTHRNITIFSKEARVMVDGKELLLTSLEYRLLLLFVQHKNQILTREQILANIWDSEEHYVNDNTLSVYIKRLRTKLEECQNGKWQVNLEQSDGSDDFIETVRGLGYRLRS